jgi:hypothetical protein
MRFTEIIPENANPKRQAAIAIAMKKAGKKPKGVAEGLNEDVGGNYLYHATGADGLKGMLSSGSIRSATGPQSATTAQTTLPTVSVTRDWNYASGGAGSSNTSVGHDAILVLDRNAVESNFKTLGTSQSQDVRGQAYTKKQQVSRYNMMSKYKTDDPEQQKDIDTRFHAPKAGGEFEEAVVVPKGSLPLKGTMVGFWVNPKSQLTKDPKVMNDPRRLELASGGTGRFVKAQQPQGVAEGSEQQLVTIYTNPAYKGATVDDRIKKSLPVTEAPFNKLQMWENGKSMKDPKVAQWVNNNLLPELKQNGKLGPLVVWNNKGKLFVIDGNHRFIAYQAAGYNGNVPVQIVPDKMINIVDTVPGKQGVAEGSTQKDMTGQTCEKCKKDKYQERSQHDDMQGKVTCSCGNRVNRWKNYKEKDVAEGENWSKHNNKRAGGMSKKSVSVYRREHPGSKIQTAVTTKPSKLKKGSKSAKRRASFCARMRGMKKHRTGAKTAHDPNSNINKSLRRWHCESIEELHELVMLAEQFVRNNKK